MLKKIILLSFLLVAFGCETTELEILDNPNVPTPESLEENALLSAIELSFSNFFSEATESSAEAVRLEYMFDEYSVNYISSNPNNINMWNSAYTGVLQNTKILLNFIEGKDLHYHAGIAKTLRAYTLMTLVDFYGDVPYSEALRGDEGIYFPSVDNQEDVYAQALVDLNSALEDFQNTPTATPSTDLFYNGSAAKWIKLVNSLKLKYYLNLRLVDQATASTEIQNLIDDDNMISSNEDNFVFQFSTAVLPNSVHPYFNEEYRGANTSDYMPNYLMWEMAAEKGIEDPRVRYYFYRQVNSFSTDPVVLNTINDCWNNPIPPFYTMVDPNMVFCWLSSLDNGYWGRDHGDSRGIPQDNNARTTFGSYPAGGKFDNNDETPIDEGDGLQGAGIWPIMTASFVDFMRAEAAVFLSTSDDAKAMMTSGVQKSISYVMSFNATPDAANVPTAADIASYVALVEGLYDMAGSNTDKMAVIGKEYHIALFGNGIEGYNLYRRTGAPVNMQPTLLNGMDFPRSFFYPSSSVDANPNLNQKSGLNVQVFWDNNPAGFIY